jgi:hypothetical protein
MNAPVWWIAVLAAATVVDGLLAGASLDQSIKQLPARHRLGARAFSAYSRAADHGTGIVWYAGLGIGGALLTLAAAGLSLLALPAAHRSLHLFALNVGESVLFGFDEAFQDDTRRIASVQQRFSDPRVLLAVVIGALVIAWMVTVYLASVGGVWSHVVTLFFGVLLLAEVEHPIRAVARRRCHCGLFTGTAPVLLGIALVLMSLDLLR